MNSLGTEEILPSIGTLLAAYASTWPSKGAGPWLSPSCDHAPHGPCREVLLGVMALL